MTSPVRPELPTASVGSSQAPTAAVDNSAPSAIRPESTYKSGNVVQTSGATSVFVRGFATRLNADQLSALVQYYSERPGSTFIDVQAKMLEEALWGISSIQQQASSGQRFLSPESPGGTHENQFRELAGLFDEALKYQLGALDPGPGHDRSGLQALPTVMLMGIETKYAKRKGLWKSIPEPDRAAIIAWRASPLAKAERDAILESAKEIRTVVDMENESQRFMKMVEHHLVKWRAELKQ